MKTSILLLALLCAGCTDEALQNKVAALEDKVATLESAQAVDYSRLDATDSRIDTLESGLLFVGNLVVKHDSIVADKQWKRDRAIRRGQFWGGFIGTLIK